MDEEPTVRLQDDQTVVEVKRFEEKQAPMSEDQDMEEEDNDQTLRQINGLADLDEEEISSELKNIQMACDEDIQ